LHLADGLDRGLTDATQKIKASDESSASAPSICLTLPSKSQSTSRRRRPSRSAGRPLGAGLANSKSTSWSSAGWPTPA